MSDYVTRIKVRHYELDTLGHVNHAVYHQYGEVARLGWFESVGGGGNGLGSHGGDHSPVLLESRIRFLRELVAGDEVEVTCDVSFGEGKTFRMDSQIRKLDGTVAAEIECVIGLLDLKQRKLLDDPRGRFRAAGLRV